jgi:Raf kinase inhibitor-like YbhB/YbcL family protein
MSMRLTSQAFEDGDTIPSVYTCEGKNMNPPLEFHDIPANAKSLVLLMDDPDVPASVRSDRMWDHWVVFNIPSETNHFLEHAAPPGVQGKNTDGQNKYMGPCPPDREHRYFFKLYALDKMLDLPSGASKKEVEHAMKGSVLAEARLLGKYEKGKGY